MTRKQLVLALAAAALATGLYLAGLGLGLSGRSPATVSVDRWAALLPTRPLVPADLSDPGRCIAAGRVTVLAGRACTLAVDSTWSPRRRALVLEPASGALSARVVPRDHPEREVNPGVLQGGPNVLPVDRAGATIVLSCGPVACVAAIR